MMDVRGIVMRCRRIGEFRRGCRGEEAMRIHRSSREVRRLVEQRRWKILTILPVEKQEDIVAVVDIFFARLDSNSLMTT